jgi:hypothetical protein
MKIKYNDDLARIVLKEPQTFLLFTIRVLVGKAIVKYTTKPIFENYSKITTIIHGLLVKILINV